MDNLSSDGCIRGDGGVIDECITDDCISVDWTSSLAAPLQFSGPKHSAMAKLESGCRGVADLATISEDQQ